MRSDTHNLTGFGSCFDKKHVLHGHGCLYILYYILGLHLLLPVAIWLYCVKKRTICLPEKKRKLEAGNGGGGTVLYTVKKITKFLDLL